MPHGCAPAAERRWPHSVPHAWDDERESRKRPRLRIKRTQIPLVPYFAVTGHAAQGKTLETAIVDLEIGSDASPLTSYVAISRVKGRANILICRPFSSDVFVRGPPEAYVPGGAAHGSALWCVIGVAG